LGYRTAYRDTMRAYEADRDAAFRRMERRRDDVYARVPRVGEIDARLSAIGLSLARVALSDAGADAASELRAESDALRDERAALLAKAGLPADYLSVPYACAACSDTGFIETGVLPERCACLKQRLIIITFPT
jgi:DNA replication protein DnaC